MSLKSKQSGIAMVEVMVTVAIITIGVSGMGMLLIRAIQGTQDSSQHSQAMWIVQDFIGRMRANPEGARASDYVLDPADIDCNTPPNVQCAATPAGNAANCDASLAQMATYDKWITTCGISDTIYDSPADFVTNPQLTSECTQLSARASSYNFQPDCIQYRVTLNWQSKHTQGAINEDDRTNINEYSMIVEFN